MDTFSLEVDWGDGTVVETFTYGAGTASFSETHQYLDDDPSGTTSDTRVITVTLTDDDTGQDTDTASLITANVAPSLENLLATDVSENGVTTLTGNIVDPGTLDTFSLEVDWGDGNVETFTYVAGVVSFSESHQYLDDDPTGTTSDTREISVTLADDDTGEDTDTASLITANVAPSIDSLDITTPISANFAATLSGTYSDIGTLDTHRLDVDWDGVNGVDETVAVTGGTFSVDHVYTNLGTFTVTATLIDDDGGVNTAMSTVRVISRIPPIVDLNGNDPGVDYVVSSPAGMAVEIGAFGRTLIQDVDSDSLSSVEVQLTFPIGGTSGTLDIDEMLLPSSLEVTRTSGPTLILTALGGTAPAEAFQQALETLVYQPTAGASAAAVTIEVTAFDEEFLASNAAEAQITFVAQDVVDPVDPDDPPIVPPPVPPLVVEDPPQTINAPDSRQEFFVVRTSDGGSGGKYLFGNDADMESPDDVIAADRALQMLLADSRVARQEEVIDAVYSLGDVELVSLLGIDMGDEPVLQKKRTSQKPVLVSGSGDPPPALPADPIAAPAVEPGQSTATLAFWSALAGGTLAIGGGLWWFGWKRRRNAFGRYAS